MKTLLATLVVFLVAAFGLAAPDKPQTMTCTILEGKAAIEIGTATAEEIKRGDVPLRCVMASSTVMYYTVPSDEYDWQGCLDAEFALPEKFFAILKGASFVTDNCRIYQRPECTAYELSLIHCGHLLPLGANKCRVP